jgi:hypothetical protein
MIGCFTLQRVLAKRLAQRAAAFAIPAFIAAGCASPTADLSSSGSTAAVVGDQRGGRIERGVDNTPAAMQAAIAHCAQFGKKAQLTRMDAPSLGGLMAFECR